MTPQDFDDLRLWAESEPPDWDLPRAAAELIDREAVRALTARCSPQTGLTIDRAAADWTERCFLRPWWLRWLVRNVKLAAITSDARTSFHLALRRRMNRDAQDVHRRSDPEYQWARQKLLKALRAAAFSRQMLDRVYWAAPPGPPVPAWLPAEDGEVAGLGDGTPPPGKQAQAQWLVSRWQHEMPRRAEVWRVAHVLKSIAQSGSVAPDEEEDGEWDAGHAVELVRDRLGSTDLSWSAAVERKAKAVLEPFAEDDADLWLKLEEIRELFQEKP